jgi:hypothetical protein
MNKIFAIGVLILAGVGLSVFLFWKKPALVSSVSSSNGRATSTEAIATSTPVGTNVFQSDMYHFEMPYPTELSVVAHDDGSNASTIVFQNPDLAEGFQIFVMPYLESHVTPDRFKKDDPSGVRTNERSVSIDGATGEAFYSKDDTLGDTYEVWFIHNGWLFEVTALKSEEDFINQLLADWKFTL